MVDLFREDSEKRVFAWNDRAPIIARTCLRFSTRGRASEDRRHARVAIERTVLPVFSGAL